MLWFTYSRGDKCFNIYDKIKVIPPIITNIYPCEKRTCYEIQLLCFWTLSIVLFLFKTTFQRLNSVSVFKWNLLSWAELIELVVHYLRTLAPKQHIQSPICCVLNKKRIVNNGQKHNNCVNIPSSQTFRC
jgi:hypothetical protein